MGSTPTNGSSEMEMKEQVEEQAPVITHSVGHVAVKPPPFYHKNPEMWFLRLESQFELSGIKNEKTKYHHVLAALPEDVICDVNITSNFSYQSLKSEVLNNLKENKHLLIDKALSAMELGDKRPSQLVCEIKRRFTDIGITIDESIVKSRLLTALPSHIKSALVGHDSVSLEQYAAIADSMLAVAQRPVASFMGHVDSHDKNRSFNRQTFQRNENRNFDRNNRKVFQPRPFYDEQRPRVCNAHIYFGNRAKHCRKWCEWPDKPNRILDNNEKTPRQSRSSSPTNS